MDVLEIVQTKMLDPQITLPTYLLAIEEVEQAIKNYCKIDKVPEELKFVEANMVVELIRYERAVTGQDSEDKSEEITIADVASISMGDTSISLGGKNTSSPITAAKKSHIPNLDEIVMNNTAQLNKFRRMVW